MAANIDWRVWWSRMYDMKRLRLIRELRNGENFGQAPEELCIIDEPHLLPKPLQEKLAELYAQMQTIT